MASSSRAIRAGDFFVSTGEVLFTNYQWQTQGPRGSLSADVNYTLPLEFVELVWGDGKTVERQVIPAADLPPAGTHRFVLPFDTANKAWIRFAVWDSSGNGAFLQPVWLNGAH